MQTIFQRFENFLITRTNTSPFSNVLGLARSVLAMGTLLTLCFNPMSNFLYVKASGAYALTVLGANTLSAKINIFTMLGVQYAWVMQLAAILILLLVISGRYMKISCWLHWWVTWSFMTASSAIDGGDQIANNLSFLFIPICMADNRRTHWDAPVAGEQPYRNLTGLFLLLIVRIQMAMIYFHAATGKFPVKEWTDGTAVYYWFNNGAFGMPGYIHSILDNALTNKFVVIGITYGTIFFEMILFLCVTMSRQYRKYFIIPAIAFHGGIILVHGIFSFFFSVAAGLCIYLLDYRRPLNWRWTKWLAGKSAATGDEQKKVKHEKKKQPLLSDGVYHTGQLPLGHLAGE